MLSCFVSSRLRSSLCFGVSSRFCYTKQFSYDQWKNFYESSFRHGWITENEINICSEEECSLDTTHKKGIPSVSFSMRVNDSMIAPTGLVHGAAISLLADTAVGFGCHCFLPAPATHFAVTNMNVNFISSASTGAVLQAKAQQIHGGKSTQTWDATVTHNGKTLAVIRSSALNLYKEERKAEKATKRPGEFELHKMTKKELAEKFDELAPQWEKYVEKYEYKPIFSWIANQTRQFLPEIQKNTEKQIIVLDLACGIGLISQCVEEHSTTPNNGKLAFYGIDISQGMLDRAKERNLFEKLQRMDMEKNPLPFSTSSVSVVTFCGATELMKDLEYVFSEVSRVLKPKGQLWVTFQSNEIFEDSTSRQGISGLRKTDISALLETKGLSVEEIVLEPKSFVTPIAKNQTKPVPYYFVRAIKC